MTTPARIQPTTAADAKLLYKVLSHEGTSRSGGLPIAWSLPSEGVPGNWQEVEGEIVMCRAGLHLTTTPALWWYEKSSPAEGPRPRIFEVEVSGLLLRPNGDVAFSGDKCVARRVRLLREITDPAELGLLGVFLSWGHEIREGKGFAYESSTVTASYHGEVAAYDSSKVTARDFSVVDARDSSKVTARDFSVVDARDSSTVTSHESSTVNSYENSTVTAHGDSKVTSYENSTVNACGNSTVTSYGSSKATACGSSKATAHGDSKVTAHGRSTVTAYGNSTVTAYGYSTVTVHGRSTVTAYDRALVIIPATNTWTYEGNEHVKVELHNDACLVDYRQDEPEFHTRESWGAKATKSVPT